MAKLLLDNALIEEEFFEDCRLWAIGSSIPGHALCWWLNQSFGLAFFRDPGLDICIKKTAKRNRQMGNSLFGALFDGEGVEEITFPVYHHNKPNTKFEIFLYGNKNRSETLLPEYKNADFLLLIKDSGYLEEYEDFTRLLSLLQVIAWEKELYIPTIKGKINLVL